MKILTVIGARPQFIKAAMVSKYIREKHDEIIVHTGQHFDANMSDIFFEELGIPEPNYRLDINSKSHAKMTGEMIMAIEEIIEKEKPDLLLVYGDTNSTLAGALTAVKMHVPICHVEAGNRLNDLKNPEEVNRIITDRISTLLLCCVESSVENLRREGVKEGVHLVGDPMYDAFVYFEQARDEVLLEGRPLPAEYYYLTCHREENTQTALFEVLSAMQSLDAPVVFPVHPRNTESAINLIEKNGFGNIIAIKPVGYLDSIALVKNAKKVITDSGGVQREAFFAGVKCVTIFDSVAWPETMVGGRNILAKPEREDILSKLKLEQEIDESYRPFGDGNSGKKILKCIEEIC